MSKPTNNSNTKDFNYLSNSYFTVTAENDIDSGANPFVYYLADGLYLIYENNTGIGQKYITIPNKKRDDNFKLTQDSIGPCVNKLKERDLITDIKRLPSKQTTGSILYQGAQGKYYIVNGYKYDEHFPYEWAINHKSVSGPEHCSTCRKYGTILTVFVGYCIDCRANIYKGNRPGINDAIKTPIKDFRMILPYMKDVCFVNIGDRKGWTLLKEREQRRIEEEERIRKDSEISRALIQKRNDLLVRTHRKEHIEEQEWEDYWGFSPVTNEELRRWATSEYA
jgi:hypothetical protein